MIADDDTTLSGVWKDLLRGAGFDVLSSESGLKALNTIRYGNKVDVVLLDYNMPLMDGARTLGHLKEQFPEVKAIGVTGVARSELPAEYCDGVEKLLVKPVKGADLIDAIQSVMGTRAAAQAEPVKRSMTWVRLIPWYVLCLISTGAIIVMLQRAVNELLSSH